MFASPSHTPNPNPSPGFRSVSRTHSLVSSCCCWVWLCSAWEAACHRGGQRTDVAYIMISKSVISVALILLASLHTSYTTVSSCRAKFYCTVPSQRAQGTLLLPTTGKEEQVNGLSRESFYSSTGRQLSAFVSEGTISPQDDSLGFNRQQSNMRA